MADLKYQRLTPARARSQFAVAFMARSSLWLGDDHLLLVETNGYTESYKRFYFRDIQAISIQQTNRYRWWAGITGFFALVFLILAIATMPKTSPVQWNGGEIAGGIFLGGIAGLGLLFLVINWILGPTCRCFLRTAVQTEELPSLCRERRTRKVFDQIRPQIVAAQGQLTLEEVSAHFHRIVMAKDPTQPIQPADPGEVPPVIT